MKNGLRIILLAAGLTLAVAGCGSSAAPSPSPAAQAAPKATVAAPAMPSSAAPTAAAAAVPTQPPAAATKAPAAPTTAPTTAPAVGGAGKEIAVFAAASLNESFTELAPAFSARANGSKVVYNFGGSNTLRSQIEQGASADIFASANEKEMDTLVKGGFISGTPSTFAKNRLVVITPKANPGKIEKLQDLAKSGLKIVAAGPSVPVGGYMLQMLDKMDADSTYGAGFKEKVMKNVISQETDVKQVVAKVQLGEGDAGVVYSTDVTVKVSPDVKIIDVPDNFNVVAIYPIAVTKDAKEKDLAKAFVDFILSTDGQGVMKKYNFATVK